MENSPQDEEGDGVDAARGDIGWDELWRCFYKTYRTAFYNELLADRMLRKWNRFEDITKFLLAVTTSGSAIATWTIWNSDGFWRYAWATVSGLSALLSIVSSSLGVGRRLDEWGQKGLEFALLRIDADTILKRMRINIDVNTPGLIKEFRRLRTQYRAVASTMPVDWLQSESLERLAKRDLDEVDEFMTRPEHKSLSDSR